jgi:hypothetical protein
MPTTSSAFRQLSDQSVPGTLLGASATDLIGFYGVTTAVARSGTNFATLSNSTGALASSIAITLGALGLIQCTSVAG